MLMQRRANDEFKLDVHIDKKDNNGKGPLTKEE